MTASGATAPSSISSFTGAKDFIHMKGEETLLDGVLSGIMRAFEELIPPHASRQPLSAASLPIALLGPSFPFLFLAYLARRADTHLIRLLVLPSAVASALYFTYHYKIEDPRYRIFEFIRFLVCYYMIGKSLNFAFVRDGRFKIGEKRLRRVNEVDPESGVDPALFPPWLRDGFELVCALRGIGWDFGRDVYIPPRTTSTQKGRFLSDATMSLIKHFLTVDLCDSLIKLVPGVGSPEGGSLFLADLPLHLRYCLSTATHILVGMVVIFGLEAGNDFVSLVAVGLFRSSPETWFPLYDSPWRSTSLHQLWGNGWHQLLRHMFLSFGGYPGLWLAGNAGMVLGAFLASGLYHELGLQMSDHRVVLFFLSQGVGILLENRYKRYTGKSVGGVVGWCWTFFWVVFVGQICTDAWAIGGLPGAVLVPRELSIVRRLVFPAMRYLAQYNASQ
ncbi:hypothetical protein DAEQUDRAFT_754538 [Daedalea quercina L-15889]|uniref:Wax synthase domain-containing protein n=1 Tax=Daedalea quercina L-15889 TaxID=1314783 RepID=A0A165TCY9_9APHY|nr:hypothetical protein DAEQUDRAFT_754538 [Daedalea quercina L-15889]